MSLKSQKKTINKVYNDIVISYETLEDCVDIWNYADSLIQSHKYSMLEFMKLNKVKKESILYLKYFVSKNDELAYKIINYIENSNLYEFKNKN